MRKDNDNGFGDSLETMDVQAFFNMRKWVENALTKAGARCTGGGMGCGVADVDIELEGYHYVITITPLPSDA